MSVPSLASAFDDLLGTPPLDGGEVVEWPVELGDHVSASSLGTFRRCPEQYRRRYLLGERERPNVNVVWGTADHRALEHNWRQKIQSREDLPVGEIQEAFAASFDERVEELGGPGEVDGKLGDAKDAGVTLVAAYHRLASPLVEPVAVERRFELAVARVPVPVVGYIDLETEGPVVERKTTGRKFTSVQGKHLLQAGVYQLATGRSIDFHASVKTKTPQILLPRDEPGLTLAVSDAGLARMERLLVTTVRQLAATFATFGPDEAWPDAIAQDGPCNYCGWGPKASNRCVHWSTS